MKPFHNLSTSHFILLIFALWRAGLEFVRMIGEYIIPKREAFLGPTPWANFDGVHYLSIAERGYVQFEQAFFPLYPMLIRFLARSVFDHNYVIAGTIISNFSVLVSLFVFVKLLSRTSIGNKRISESTIRWSLIFFLVFPTSFYFASLYTESLFVLLVFTSFYFFRRTNKLWYGLFASLASATKLIGSFLMVPVGLFWYMIYLSRNYQDPFLFIHAQPAFGGNRTGGEIILLPQVFWRYMKIFVSVPFSRYDWWIALLELVVFAIVVLLLWTAWRKHYPSEWIYFSVAAFIGPTLTGTFSSIPRYALVAFPMYVVLGSLQDRYKLKVLVVMIGILVILTMLFTRGWWVS